MRSFCVPVRSARDFSDHNPDNGSLGDFLENISLASDYEETQDSDNFVSLMTVHAAKVRS